jgi:hypothetical protein
MFFGFICNCGFPLLSKSSTTTCSSQPSPTMPRTRPILDSSPIAVASPGVRQPKLKRSASTASLPTPPRTLHKRTRSRSSAWESDSDSRSEDDPLLDSDDGALLLGNKKRRMSPRAPVSPPPSRRQTTARVARPETPKQSTSTTQVDDSSGPVRDSPNNPFLAHSPLDGSIPEPRTPSPPAEFVEKPTITYVLYVVTSTFPVDPPDPLMPQSRGMKAEFENPLFHISPSARARAALPLDHPEYSPTAACPPRLLFPEAHKAKHRYRSPEAGDAAVVLPKRLTFQKELELLHAGAGEDRNKVKRTGRDSKVRRVVRPACR